MCGRLVASPEAGWTDIPSDDKDAVCGKRHVPVGYRPRIQIPQPDPGDPDPSRIMYPLMWIPQPDLEIGSQS